LISQISTNAKETLNYAWVIRMNQFVSTLQDHTIVHLAQIKTKLQK